MDSGCGGAVSLKKSRTFDSGRRGPKLRQRVEGIKLLKKFVGSFFFFKDSRYYVPVSHQEGWIGPQSGPE